jgi:hypothetical protein
MTNSEASSYCPAAKRSEINQAARGKEAPAYRSTVFQGSTALTIARMPARVASGSSGDKTPGPHFSDLDPELAAALVKPACTMQSNSSSFYGENDELWLCGGSGGLVFGAAG